MYATTRDIILGAYPHLSRLRPERRGVPKDKARWSRERARANRWPDLGDRGRVPAEVQQAYDAAH